MEVKSLEVVQRGYQRTDNFYLYTIILKCLLACLCSSTSTLCDPMNVAHQAPLWNFPGRNTRVKSLSHVQLFGTPWTVAYQAPLSMEFPRQEYWSGLPFPPPGDLPNTGI